MIRVVKIGGNVVDNPALLKSFVADFARLEGPRVLVHGGGVLASQMQKELGMTPTMIQGRRVTDEQTLTARVSSRSTARSGDTIKVALEVSRMHIFDKDTEKCIIH